MKMIMPELRHNFAQLIGAVNGADHRRGDRFKARAAAFLSVDLLLRVE
jgi:hypothetical protein